MPDAPLILIVDDTPANVMLLTEVLEMEGYRVQYAGSAEEAGPLLAQEMPDLILIDIQLPGMDGLTFTRRLKAAPETRHIKIAAVTAAAMKGDREKAIDAGCDSYLTKPIDTRALPQVVAMLLGRAMSGGRPKAGAVVEAAKPVPLPASAQRVLVVDDLAANRLLLREILDTHDYAVVEAADGVEALAILQRERIDAIISDVLMPNMDGFRLCMEVRKHPAFSPLPFVVYTSTYNSAGDRALAEKAGADSYLIKPAPADTVIATLRAAMDRAAQRPQHQPSRTLDEFEVLKHYNSTLVAKLEEKNADLEAAVERLTQQTRLLELARDAISVQDLGDGVRYWNAGAAQLYGWSAEEAGGRSICELLQPDPAQFHTAKQTVLKAGQWSGEMNHVNKSGAAVVVSSRWTLLRAPDGAPQSILVINTDITEKKQLEIQSYRTQRLEAIGMLASGVAHDLNNMLAPIMMSAPLLRETGPAKERAKLVETIEASVRRGADLVGRLLAFSRGMEGGRLALDPRYLVHETVKIARETFPRNIVIAEEIPRETWQVVGDTTQLNQVLLNLCVNARDAMPQGGTLTVAIENTPFNPTIARLIPDAAPVPYVVIRVTDSGTGMPPEVLAKIFDPFFTTKAANKGTGLGLVTVANITKSHGGCVDVESKPGEGSTFRIYLPAASGQAAAIPAAPPAPPPRGQDELLLVVDDDEVVRGILSRTLTQYGYRVVAAADGIEGVAQYAQQQGEIKAVITDLDMPEMNGAMMIQVIKKIAPDLKAIVSSGVASQRELERRQAELKALGIETILRKPYRPEIILRAVHEILHPAGSRPAAGSDSASSSRS